MALFNPKIPEYNYTLPFFMLDLYNLKLITSQTVPGDIIDDKKIILTETPIPGLNYAPIQPSGNANRKVSFTLPLLKRNNTIGNSLIVNQFHVLRNQGGGLKGIFSQQFQPNPKVLFNWGIASVPLIYFVSKCQLTHKKHWVNQQGQPQYSEVQIELILD